LILENMRTDRLFKDGSIMVFSAGISLFFAYLFHIYVARTLGASDYGVYGSLLALFNVLGTFIGALQTSITKFVSYYYARRDYDLIKSIIKASLKIISLFSFAGLVIVVLLSPFISEFLRIDSNTPIMLLGISSVTYIYLSFVRGILAGKQDFYALGINASLEKIALFIAGIAAISAGLGVNGAVLSIGISSLAMILISLPSLRFINYGKKLVKVNLRRVFNYAIPVLITYACIGVMVSMDLVVVKHYFSSQQAGYFTSIDMIGKSVYFACMGFMTALFPKTSNRYICREEAMSLLRKSVLYFGSFCFVALAIGSLFHEEIVGLLYGSQYLYAASLLPVYILAISIFSLSIILIFFNLSINNLGYIPFLMGSLILEVLLMGTIHSQLVSIIHNIIISSMVLLLSNIYFAFYRGGKLIDSNVRNRSHI
jgi:O-antigen/teichoic acid export membrane protein